MSGHGEILMLSSVFLHYDTTTVNNTMTNNNASWFSDTNLLLCILLAVCMCILVLLVCLLACFCCRFVLKRSNGSRKANNVKTVLITKATSVTGLNQTNLNEVKSSPRSLLKVYTTEGAALIDNSNQNFNNGATQSKDCATNTFAIRHQNLMTSTPTVRENGARKCNSIVALVTSPQSTITGVDWQSFKHDTPYANAHGTINTVNNEPVSSSYQVMSPVTQQGVLNWATTNDILDANSPNSVGLYGTAFSQLDSNPLSEENDLDSASEVKELLSPLQVPVSSECSPLTPNGVSSSLPLDVHGHPRAWFVPLDEIYHEPLRHSFIDVSNHNFDLVSGPFPPDQKEQDFRAINSPGSNTSNQKLNGSTKVTSRPKGIATSQSSGSEIDRSDCFNWRDSGVPVSHMNLIKSSSSECENKKPSLWEQREDRPVVFLEDNAGELVSPELEVA
ncbi:uncharacterized protein LOC100180127 [Ciona intestinalis]